MFLQPIGIVEIRPWTFLFSNTFKEYIMGNMDTYARLPPYTMPSFPMMHSSSNLSTIPTWPIRHLSAE